MPQDQAPTVLLPVPPSTPRDHRCLGRVAAMASWAGSPETTRASLCRQHTGQHRCHTPTSGSAEWWLLGCKDGMMMMTAGDDDRARRGFPGRPSDRSPGWRSGDRDRGRPQQAFPLQLPGTAFLRDPRVFLALGLCPWPVPQGGPITQLPTVAYGTDTKPAGNTLGLCRLLALTTWPAGPKTL